MIESSVCAGDSISPALAVLTTAARKVPRLQMYLTCQIRKSVVCAAPVAQHRLQSRHRVLVIPATSPAGREASRAPPASNLNWLHSSGWIYPSGSSIRRTASRSSSISGRRSFT